MAMIFLCAIPCCESMYVSIPSWAKQSAAGISPSLIAGIQDRHDLQAALFRVDQCFRDRF
jgi:hypothetical protein